jgi:hypothetical protein
MGLAAGADDDLADAPGRVGSGVGSLGGEALVVVVVADQDDVGPGLVQGPACPCCPSPARRQRLPGRRHPAGAWPVAAGLRRLRSGRRRHRHLGRQVKAHPRAVAGCDSGSRLPWMGGCAVQRGPMDRLEPGPGGHLHRCLRLARLGARAVRPVDLALCRDLADRPDLGADGPQRVGQVARPPPPRRAGPPPPPPPPPGPRGHAQGR